VGNNDIRYYFENVRNILLKKIVDDWDQNGVSFIEALEAVEHQSAEECQCPDCSAERLRNAKVGKKITKQLAEGSPETTNSPTPKLTPEKQKETEEMAMTTADREKAEQDLAKLRDISIVRQGTKLVVPEGIGLDVAIKALTLKQREEEQEVGINITLPIEVAEGMVGFLRVLEREYGFVTNTGQQSFFGNRPPEYLGIETTPGHRESIPVGRLMIPGISGYLTPTFNVQKNRVVFRVEGEVKGKDRHVVDKIMAMVEEECKRNSIYKGRAIMTAFPVVEDCSSLEDTFLTFAKLNPVKTEELIFSKETEDQITVSLFVPIMQTEACRKNSIPLKRGILLEGPYGTGKTLTAAATANLCAQNGWTFIYLKDVKRLAYAYAFAAQYQPAVIFAEDIDQIINGDDSEDEINDIQNAMDGIDSKGVEVITVLTTNFLEKITRAMLRPGRLDTVVSVRAPDREAAVRLVRMYARSEGRDLLDPSCDLENSNVGDILAGEIPAIIREVVERSKLAALRRNSGVLTLTPDDIEVTAKSMKAHMNLLKTPEPDARSEREKAISLMLGQ
jgi:transitional endoplasmic reticulum ATPase